MKRTIIAFCLLLSALVLYAKGIQEDINYSEEKSKVGYALGLVVGADLEPTGLDLDYAAFAEGLKIAMEQGPARYSQDEAADIVQNAFEAAMERRMEENRNKETEFLSTNGARPEVQMTPSGLQYEVLTEGEGEKPTADDVVRVHYEGTLIDGSVFDNSYDRGDAEVVPLRGVIPGWAEGLQLMSEGSTYRLYIPSNLAYGEQGAGPVIPPNSTLIFTVELLEIVKLPEIDFSEDTEEADAETEEDEDEVEAA